MKWILVLLVVIASFFRLTEAQIRIITPSNNILEKVRYDSLNNYYTDINLYIGQRLYLMKGNEKRDFVNKQLFKRKINDSTFYFLNSVPPTGYYDVKSIIRGEHLELASILGETYIYTFPKMGMNFYFFTEGFYKKQVEIYKGKDFVIYSDGGKIKDINNMSMEISEKEIVTCDDVFLDEEQGFCYPLFKKGSHLFRSGGHTFQTYLYPVEMDRLMSVKYKDFWYSIARKKVKVGMTEKMVIESWGEPKNINQASYGNQWVYDDQYLYFKNGILTSYN